MHIVFLNPQGNFDAKDSYLTEHPDFGGQLVYVKEVAQALVDLGHKVDIVTRRIRDAAWPEAQAAPKSTKPPQPARHGAPGRLSCSCPPTLIRHACARRTPLTEDS